VTTTDEDSTPNYSRLRKSRRLWGAWERVRAGGLLSTSPRARAAIREFEANARAGINGIATDLRGGTFELRVAKAANGRSGKAPRPLSVADVRVRVVQQALLDELRSVDSLRPAFDSPNSFGGIGDRGRADAVREALKEIDSGKSYFLRSSIKDFVLRTLQDEAVYGHSAQLDEPTTDLLIRATRLERAGAAELGAMKDELPEEERGVVQGFALSSLFANVTLAAFDEELNGRGIRCIRYVDELLLLGESERKVLKAFDSALDLLVKLGVEAHDPRTGSEQAARGRTDRPFDFLGCSIQRGLVRPGHQPTKRLLDNVAGRLSEGVRHLGSGGKGTDRQHCVPSVLHDVGDIVREWRRSFDCCEQPFVFRDVDKAIGVKLAGYVDELRRAYDQADEAGRRAILGVPSLAAPSK